METNSLVPPRHELLPKGLNTAETADWLRKSAKESFTEEVKRRFDPEELTELKHEAVMSGIGINKLNKLLEEVKSYIKHGNDKAITMTFPPSAGQKRYTEYRHQNEEKVEKGFEVVAIQVYGIPCPDSMNMLFFTEDGQRYPECDRSLRASEKHEYGGLFLRGSNTSDGFVDHGTGELHTGTQG